MIWFVVLSIQIAVTLGAVADCCPSCACNNHTVYYETGNLSLLETYLPRQGYDPCTPYGNRSQYIDDLQAAGIDCTGPWCSTSGNFSCTGLDCWQVGHIYDLANSPFSAEYDLNVYGNIIMSYGRWNQAVSQKTWPIVQAEKSYIYRDIMDEAGIYLHLCSRRNITMTETITQTVSGSSLVFIVIISVSITLLFTLVILYKMALHFGKKYTLSSELQEPMMAE